VWQTAGHAHAFFCTVILVLDCRRYTASFFDPAHYRVVLFDQRGAGQSTPLGEHRQNTTQLLISDIEPRFLS